MPAKATVGYTPPHHLDFLVEGVDREHLGTELEVEVVHVTTVQDYRPVHGREVVWSSPVALESPDLMLPITIPSRIPYAWSGTQIDVSLDVVLKRPARGWFTGDQVIAEASVDLPRVYRVAVPEDAALMEPKDQYELSRAFASLGPAARQRVMVRAGSFIGGALAVLGLVWFSGWTMLVFFWLIGTLIAGKFVFDQIWNDLASYVPLEFGFVPPLDPETVLPVGTLLQGSPRLDLPRPRLRIVACNLERGQYRRGSGTDVRTVSFSEPVGTVVLYDETLEVWRAGVTLEEAFRGEVDFAEAFARLAPPVAIGEDHGIGLRWEAQLMVPDLVDVEVEGPIEVWMWPDDWRPGA